MAFALGEMAAMAQFGRPNIQAILTSAVALVILVLGVLRFIWRTGVDNPTQGT
jgi:hypothetical protein